MIDSSRGHSLIEVVVALLILTGGLLGATASTVVAERWAAAGRARLKTTVALRRRMEALRRSADSGSRGCGLRGGGTAAEGAWVQEQWQVDSTSDGSSITIVGSYPTLGGRSSDTLATILGCQ